MLLLLFGWLLFGWLLSITCNAHVLSPGLAQAQLFKSKATDTKTLRNTFKFLESIVSAVQLFGAKLDVYVYLPDHRQHWCLC
jgi:hypothetical protein